MRASEIIANLVAGKLQQHDDAEISFGAVVRHQLLKEERDFQSYPMDETKTFFGIPIVADPHLEAHAFEVRDRNGAVLVRGTL
jgi:hypothetical protein